jgi:predicted metal-dependent peptidase
VWAGSRFPYLASALFAAEVLGRPAIGTVAVDPGWHVHADPAVIDGLRVPELANLLVHLTGHLLRDHAARAAAVGADEDGARARWNLASDAEINDDLSRDQAVPEVAGGLPGDLGCEEGRLAEEYFTRVRPAVRHWDCGSGCDGGPRPWDATGGIGPEQAELLALGVAAEIQRHQGQLPGTVPGGWLRWAESRLPSQVDWRRVLAAEIRRGVAMAAGKVDYTYRRPSRRNALTPDVVLPSLFGPLPDVAVVCDTSASMHGDLLARALAEVEGLLTKGGLRHAQLRVLAVDTNVHSVRRVSRASQVQLTGGGGTDMGSGILSAAAMKPPPSVIVVLTDGFTPWPEAPPKGPRVIVGLLEQDGIPGSPVRPPTWAHTVHIVEPGRLA